MAKVNREQCHALTKKGARCPNLCAKGKRLCHVHDPAALFRQQHPLKAGRRQSVVEDRLL